MYWCTSTGKGAACLMVELNITKEQKTMFRIRLRWKLLRKEIWIFSLFLSPRELEFTSLLWPWFLCLSICCSLCCVFGELFSESALLTSLVLCPLQTTVANCISVNHDYIFCGCADGTVRIFNPLNLHFVTTLPKPHFLGTDIASVTEARYCGEDWRGQGRLMWVKTVHQAFAIWIVLFLWTKIGSVWLISPSSNSVAWHGWAKAQSWLLDYTARLLPHLHGIAPVWWLFDFGLLWASRQRGYGMLRHTSVASVPVAHFLVIAGVRAEDSL